MNINDITPRRLNELSANTLASYKKKAGAAATAADAAGDVKTGNQRFSGIVKATKKQFDQDAKGKKTNEAAAVPAAAALPAQGVKQPWLPTNKAKAAPVAAAKPLPTTPSAPVAAPVAAAKPLPTTPAAPPAAPVAAATPAVDPVQQKADQMQQSLLDRMGKRFGLPPGSSQEQVQAAQQEYLNKNDPAAAAQYQQNMANIEAGGSQADNKPVQLAPTAAPAKPQQSADWTAGLAAQQAGGSPIAIMLAQPSIAGNQAMLDNIAKPLGLPPGSTAAEISAADAKQPSVKQQGIDSLAADQGYAAGTSVEQMAIDNIAKMAGLPTGMTQDEMMAAYAKKTQAARAAVSAAPVAEHYVLDELDHGKLIESQLDNTLDDLYETLNEFAPGGAEGAGPYAYGIALKEMAELYAKGEFDLVDVSGMDTASQNQSDAEEINSVADAFMNRGMEAGREAYSMVDTMVQEDMDEYLHGQGFNVDADIHAEYQNDVDRYNDSPAGQADKDQQAQQDAEWEEDLPTWRAAQVEIAAVNPKNQSSVLHSVQFDARKYNSSVGQLKSTLEQQLNKIKQSTPGSVIRITLGGKPTDIQGILAQFKQLSNKQGVAEDSLAGMKRLAGIAPAQTQTTPGQRQYRNMPTAVQTR